MVSRSITNNRSRVEELRQWLFEKKHMQSCSDCTTCYPAWVLDFDHREGVEKEMDIGKMVCGAFSKEKILQEMQKCDLVCANCHRTRTHSRAVKAGQKKDRTLSAGSTHTREGLMEIPTALV